MRTRYCDARLAQKRSRVTVEPPPRARMALLTRTAGTGMGAIVLSGI
jgi:hypothetical protein